MPARVEPELVIVGASDDVVLIGRIDRDRCLVGGAGLLAVRIDIGGGLGHCRADSVARMGP